jgi:hypothetical protein
MLSLSRLKISEQKGEINGHIAGNNGDPPIKWTPMSFNSKASGASHVALSD